MAYRLQTSESIADGLKRIVREEIDSASSRLRGERKSSRDDDIHEARKSIKKIRAVLKLARGEMGSLYDVENGRLRDIARKLSTFRDAAAILETFDDLEQRYAGEPEARQLTSLGTALRKQKQGADEADISAVLKETETALRRVAESAAAWPLNTDGFDAIKPGLKETYQRGRKALAQVKESPCPENFHELRKRAKDLLYHVRLIKDLLVGIHRGHYERKLKELETGLGNEHNLFLLRAEIADDPPSKSVLGLIDKHREELRGKALKAAERLYIETPKEYIRRIGI